jgi:hypothetical protein
MAYPIDPGGDAGPVLSPPPMSRSQAPAVTGIPRIFGTLSIIFASIVMLFGLMSMLGGLIPLFISKGVDGLPGKPADLQPMLSAMRAVYGGLGLIGIVLSGMSGALLAIGIGQLRYRAWAQRWSVYWGIAGLVGVTVMVLVSVLVIGPGYMDMFSAIPTKHGGASPAAGMGAIGNVFGGVYAMMFVMFYAPYPILMIAFFNRAHVKSAMLR